MTGEHDQGADFDVFAARGVDSGASSEEEDIDLNTGTATRQCQSAQTS